MVKRFSCHGWDNRYRFSNGVVELFVTTDVGPMQPGESVEQVEHWWLFNNVPAEKTMRGLNPPFPRSSRKQPNSEDL
jgi:hypothetical protein